MSLRSLGSRAGRTGRTLVVVGALVGASIVGISSPAMAASGQWCNTVGMWVTYSTSKTKTTIEPHEMFTAYAGIARYTGSGVVYYYGPGVENLPNEHKKSTVSASNGTFSGNYFKTSGVRFKIPDPANEC